MVSVIEYMMLLFDLLYLILDYCLSEQEMITQTQYKKESRVKRIFKGVISALNPFSEVVLQNHAAVCVRLFCLDIYQIKINNYLY
jgi:hypothetical protein